MNEIAEITWRAYPAALLMGAGAWLALRGLCRGLAHDPRRRATRRLLEGLSGFRLCVVGLAVTGVGAAWMWQIGWLFALALIIGGEELLESTVLIAALRHAKVAE